MTLVEELGADGFAYGTTDLAGTAARVTVRVGGRDSVRKGDTLFVVPEREMCTCSTP